MLYIAINATLADRAQRVGLSVTDAELAHMLRLICGLVGAFISAPLYKHLPNTRVVACVLLLQVAICVHTAFVGSLIIFYVETALAGGLVDMANTGVRILIR